MHTEAVSMVTMHRAPGVYLLDCVSILMKSSVRPCRSNSVHRQTVTSEKPLGSRKVLLPHNKVSCLFYIKLDEETLKKTQLYVLSFSEILISFYLPNSPSHVFTSIHEQMSICRSKCVCICECLWLCVKSITFLNYAFNVQTLNNMNQYG